MEAGTVMGLVVTLLATVLSLVLAALGWSLLQRFQGHSFASQWDDVSAGWREVAAIVPWWGWLVAVVVALVTVAEPLVSTTLPQRWATRVRSADWASPDPSSPGSSSTPSPRS